MIGAIEGFLAQALDAAKEKTGGAVADYIPQLAKVDPNLFGVALTTCDGSVYAAGDAEAPFTIQSISKTFVYAAALQRCGRERVERRVGVEPTGEAFNAIVLDHENNRPFNPMVNAGAIAVTNLLMHAGAGYGLEDLRAEFAAFAGEELTIDEAVFASEKETGHRNRAIAYLMLNSGMIQGDTEATLDLYFQQCSVNVTCRALSMMAATLANEGCNPKTGERVLSEAATQDVLTVMSSCGMYNYAGQWAFEIGMPAKSGVSGGIIAVAPGQFGVAVYAPQVDKFGASLRGVEICRALSERLHLHGFRNRLTRTPVIRRDYLGFDFASSRLRAEADCARLAERREELEVLEVQGSLFFAPVETLTRRLAGLSEAARYVLLDFRRIEAADDAALELLAEAVRLEEAKGRRVMISHAKPELQEALGARRPGRDAWAGPLAFETTDVAIEWCEDQVLGTAAPAGFEARLALASLDLLEDFTRAEIQLLERNVQAFVFEAGETVLREGDPATLFFVVATGRVAVTVRGLDGAPKKISSIGPGLAFGEMALLDGRPRSATVVAEERLVAYGLSVAFFQEDEPGRAEMRSKLLANLARQLSSRLRRANEAIQTLL